MAAARLVSVGALLAGCLVGPLASQVSAGDATSYGGRATAIQVSVLGNPAIRFGDTGELPASGGIRSDHEFSTSGVVDAKLLAASVVGAGDSTTAQTSVANLSIDFEGNTISADFIATQASATCGLYTPLTDASAQITDLEVNGSRVPVGSRSNRRVSLGGGVVLVVNEQHHSEDAVVVNALHLYARDVVDLVVASSQARVTCVPEAPAPAPTCFPIDGVTGGGWIQSTASGDKANFTLEANNQHGRPSGNLNFIDHGLRLKVKGSSITSYTATGPTSRHIEGTAQINGQTGTFAADVTDNGEQGSGDTFSLRLSTGYATSGNLRGGNIQLHANTCI